MSKLEEALWQAFDGSLAVSDIAKHADHDQTTHGNWARQGQLPGIDWDGFKISDMERLKRSIGLRPGQEIWQHPVMREAFWRGEVPDDEWEAEYAVIEHVEGEWAKFGPARQIRDAAEKLLGLKEPERGDPTLDPYQESGRDASWGGGEDRVSDEEARVMALWFLEQSAQVEGKFYRGTEASVERMNLSEGDEFDVGLLSFTESPHTAASFGAETIFVVENPIGYQGEKLDMAVRYTDWDVDEFYNVVRTHAEKAELEDMYGEDIFVVGDLVSEEAHPELFYDAFDSDSPNLDKEHLITGSYRIASIERVNPASGLRVSDMEPYATDKGEVLGVVDVVTLQPIDRDGDGIILEGTDEERFVGKAEKSRRPAWLRLFELSLGEMALASSAVTKHADHDQSSHGNWAKGRGGRKATLQTETYGEYVEVVGVTTADGQRFKASRGVDAVPGGLNGFISLTSDTGEQAGRISYQMLTGEAADRYGTDLTIGMVEVSPSFQRRGLGTALVDALRAEFPGEEINIGYQTDDGAKLAEAYQSSLIDEPS